jgi:hypothetical protein
MAKRTVVPLFISSSSDCTEERDAIMRAVDAYNQVARENLDIEVFPFTQDDLYAGPAKPGEHAQQVTNRQLKDYEIYVGVWRESLGTPTTVASSGTAEELRKAFERRELKRRPWVMAYFWRPSPTDFSAIKAALRERSCFYQQFVDTIDLERRFLRHLSGYLRDGYRLKGHSTTQLGEHSKASALGSVHMTFDVHTKAKKQRYSFDRSAVAVGRQPERNDIVVSSQEVHREQGVFMWIDGIVFYNDVGGDSRVESATRSEGPEVAYGQYVIAVGDWVLLPDGSRITLLAAVS